ncbi:hypothetical protein [Salmonella enterica]|uniref:hypothetical protein n=1 Tax=Salmonella enterica TaxID=28901 RepID=UPI0009AE7510|nr:hypothetical protein [Salmonella enterica]WIF48476.1 hypothetical protein QN088_23505 [Salmonella enterica subsp. enterica]
METRCPEGAGQRQLCWLGAQHDSPGSRQGSRPASAKPVREYQQLNEQEQEQEQEQAAYYHRQEKKAHTLARKNYHPA